MITQHSLVGIVNKYGEINTIKRKRVKEMIGATFVVKKFKTVLSGRQRDYVNNKLKKYSLQAEHAIKKLKNNRKSRQSVIHFSLTGSKPECMQIIQFFIRGKKVHVIVFSRSLDIKNKINQDIETAYRFGVKVASRFNIDVGIIKFYVGNLHYYL